MSSDYGKLLPALKKLLPDEKVNALGRVVAFIQRLRAIQASVLVWSVVLSRFGQGRPGFEQARQWYERLAGSVPWPRAFQMRFKEASAVKLFAQAFEQAVSPWRSAERPRPKHRLARLFADVVLWDSTLLQVDDALKRWFPGTRKLAAGCKAVLAISVFGWVPLFARIASANKSDFTLLPPLKRFAAGTLWLFDKGFVCVKFLRQIARCQMHYLCPMRQDGNPMVVGVRRAPAYVRKALRRSPGGVRLRSLLPKDKPIRQPWDLDVYVRPRSPGEGSGRYHLRLVIVPGPRHRRQLPYFTNLSAVAWNPAQLRELYRLRWQIELTFKELKQSLNLEQLPTKDRHAVRVFIWASLIALAVSRIVSGWLVPLERLVGLASPIRPFLVTRALRAHIRVIGLALAKGSRAVTTLLLFVREELLAEVQSRDRRRDDSFARVKRLLTVGETA